MLTHRMIRKNVIISTQTIMSRIFGVVAPRAGMYASSAFGSLFAFLIGRSVRYRRKYSLMRITNTVMDAAGRGSVSTPYERARGARLT